MMRFTSETTKKDRVPVLCSQRWTLAYVGFFGFCVAFSLRDNINVAIVCMVRTNVTFHINETKAADSDCVPEGLVYSHYNEVSNFV